MVESSASLKNHPLEGPNTSPYSPQSKCDSEHPSLRCGRTKQRGKGQVVGARDLLEMGRGPIHTTKTFAGMKQGT